MNFFGIFSSLFVLVVVAYWVFDVLGFVGFEEVELKGGLRKVKFEIYWKNFGFWKFLASVVIILPFYFGMMGLKNQIKMGPSVDLAIRDIMVDLEKSNQN